MRAGNRIVMAPSGVPKERLAPQDMFELDLNGEVVRPPADESLRLSACAPLFLHAFNKRNAGAVIHTHSINAMMSTMRPGSSLSISHVEMLKGLEGVGYHDVHEVPIIENTAHECDLADALADAMDAYPKAHAVLVRRHGAYIWGDSWVNAKRHAEVYDYLFDVSNRVHAMGIDPSKPS